MFAGKRRRPTQRHRWGVYCVLREIAEFVGRATTTGRPRLWRLKADSGSL